MALNKSRIADIIISICVLVVFGLAIKAAPGIFVEKQWLTDFFEDFIEDCKQEHLIGPEDNVWVVEQNPAANFHGIARFHLLPTTSVNRNISRKPGGGDLMWIILEDKLDRRFAHRPGILYPKQSDIWDFIQNGDYTHMLILQGSKYLDEVVHSKETLVNKASLLKLDSIGKEFTLLKSDSYPAVERRLQDRLKSANK